MQNVELNVMKFNFYWCVYLFFTLKVKFQELKFEFSQIKFG